MGMGETSLGATRPDHRTCALLIWIGFEPFSKSASVDETAQISGP